MKSILVLIAISPLALAYAAGDDDLWEVTTTVNMPNLPSGARTPQTRQVCTEKGKYMKAWTTGGKCEILDFKEYQNSVTMTVRCPNTNGEVDMIYNTERTAYTGTARITNDQGLKMSLDVTGKRIGTCDAQQANSKR